jgi:hypothetical protein
MPSFLSNENINYLKYELRKIYPEDRWADIQDHTREIVLTWFKMHPQLIIVYEQHGVNGLNRKFLSDVYQSPAFISNPSVLDQDNVLYNREIDQHAQSDNFFMDAADPNIEQNQDMPRITSWPASMRKNSYQGNQLRGNLPPSKRLIKNNNCDIAAGKLGFESSQDVNNYIAFNDSANMYPYNNNGKRINYGLERINPDYQAEFNLNRINPTGNYNTVDGVSGIGSRFYTDEFANTLGPSMRNLRQEQILSAQANKWFTGSNLDNAIYNKYGYRETPLTSNYFPNGSCADNTKRKISQLRFGDVPVISVLDAEELNLVGHKLYRARHRPLQKRLVSNREETERIDDVTALKTREKFYLNEMYNSPESQITRVREPRLGNSSLVRDMTRSRLEHPCAEYEEPARIPYPAKDYVPAKMDIAY